MENCMQTDSQPDHPHHPLQLNSPLPLSHEAINANFSDMIADDIFNPVMRHLDDAHDAEDRFQEALCLIWRDYYSAAMKGHSTDRGALVHGLRLKAFDPSHCFVPGRRRRRDVMGAMACLWDGIQVLRFDGLPDVEPGPYADNDLTRDNPMSFVDAVSYAATRDVEDQLVSAFDLEAWLDEQTEQDRRLLAARLAGGSFQECGKAVGMSVSRAHHRLKALGRELAQTAKLSLSV